MRITPRTKANKRPNDYPRLSFRLSEDALRTARRLAAVSGLSVGGFVNLALARHCTSIKARLK